MKRRREVDDIDDVPRRRGREVDRPQEDVAGDRPDAQRAPRRGAHRAPRGSRGAGLRAWVTSSEIRRPAHAAAFPMIAYGGAGPLHAVQIAREIGTGKVIIPRAPGHFCAFGMLFSDLRKNKLGGKAVYMLMEIEPSSEVTGGLAGNKNFDAEQLEILQIKVLEYLKSHGHTTYRDIALYIK